MPKQPDPHPGDILIVRNIDVDCSQEDEGFNHKDCFRVNWGGKPYSITPGESKRFPRFLAEHYAKHLANHIYDISEDKSRSRQEIIDESIVKVDEWYNADPLKDENEEVSDWIETLNKEQPDA